MKSKYSHYINASRTRKALVSLLDKAILLIITFIVYIGFINLIGNNLPNVKTSLNNANEINIKTNEYLISSHLIEYDKDNNQLESKEIIDNILKSISKSSLIYHHYEDDYIYFDNYQNIDEIDYFNNINDNLYYYYFIFNNNSEIVSNTNNFYTYYTKILNGVEPYFITSLINENKESYFTIEVTISLSEYFFKEDDSFSDTYNKLYTIYLNAFNEARHHLETTDITYINYLNEFNNNYQIYLNSIIIELFISYIIGVFLTYFLPYLIYKDYDSFSKKIFKLPSTLLNGNRLKITNILLKNLLELFSNFFILIFIILLSYGNISLITYNFIHLNILSLAIFSLFIILISFIISFINKDHQYLSEFISLSITKDEREIIKDE